jgi:alkaline phosphatase D
VASGDPRPDSIVLWTRAVEAANPGADVAVRLEVATNRNFSTLVVRSETLLAQAPTDHTVKVKITNLKPRTTYYYRFVTTAQATERRSPIGRTRTAPLPSEAVNVSCVCQLPGLCWPALQQLAALARARAGSGCRVVPG